MITHIQGKLVEKNPTNVVIDCNGVGYLINISKKLLFIHQKQRK